jgi:hypothetical protein
LSPHSRSFRIEYIAVKNIDEYLAISIAFIIVLKNWLTRVSSFGMVYICCIINKEIDTTNNVNDITAIINILIE